MIEEEIEELKKEVKAQGDLLTENFTIYEDKIEAILDYLGVQIQGGNNQYKLRKLKEKK